MDKVKTEDINFDIYKLLTLLENEAPNGEYEITLRYTDKEQIIQTAKDRNIFLFHPCESKP